MGNIAIYSPSKTDTNIATNTHAKSPSQTPKLESEAEPPPADPKKDTNSSVPKEETSHKKQASSEITAWGSTTGKLYLSDPEASPRGPEDRSVVTEFIMGKVGCKRAEKKDDGGEEAAESK